MTGQRERDAAGRGAVEGTGPMCKHDPECLGWRWCNPQRGLKIVHLRIVGAPAARIVDADERERSAPMLD